jgi:hypothetical protein
VFSIAKYLRNEATTKQKTMVWFTSDSVVYPDVFLCCIITLRNGYYAKMGSEQRAERGRL